MSTARSDGGTFMVRRSCQRRTSFRTVTSLDLSPPARQAATLGSPRLPYHMRRETRKAHQPAMQLRASFFGTAGELAFSGFVYQMGGTLHRAQIRFVPKDASIDATM